MTRPSDRGVAIGLYRACLLAFPRDHRERFGEEMTSAFRAAYADRRRTGRGARAFAVRACFDTLRAGLGHRFRSGPAPHAAPRAPLARAGSAGRFGGDFGRDVKIAARALARSPAYAAATVLVLALGIGANTAVFSALRMVVLAPSPFPEPERIVYPKVTQRVEPRAERALLAWSWPKLESLRASTAGVLEPLAGYARRAATISEPGGAERIDVEIVTPGYFELLDIEPVLGRAFGPEEGEAEAAAGVALVGHDLWTTRFGADPAALGARTVLNGVPLTVVGVLPRGFRGLTGTAQVWVTMGDAPAVFSIWMSRDPQAHWLHALGRLAPGVAFDDAGRRMRAAGADLAAAFPAPEGRPGDWGADLLALDEIRRNPAARTSVLVLAGAAALVLLIGVANLAALVTVRAAARERETAVRLALGAGRWGLARTLGVEAGLLALAGCLAGIGVAQVGVRAIAAAWPASFTTSASAELQVIDPRALALDGELLAFALALSVATLLLVAMLPLARQSRLDLAPALRRNAGAPAGGRPLARRMLVASQIAVAVVLLVGAGLMMESLRRLQAVPAGFDPDGLLFLTYSLPSAGEGPGGDAFQSLLVERVEDLPGVLDAALASDAPFSGVSWTTRAISVEGRPAIPTEARPLVGVTLADSSFLPLLRVRHLAGAGLDAGEPGRPPQTAVLSRTAARTLFGDDDPVGRHVEMELSFDPATPVGRYRVVGVVEDVLYGAPDEVVLPHVYFPITRRWSSLRLAVRTEGDPADVVARIRATLAGLQPDAPIHEVVTGPALAARVTGDTRLVLALLGLFAGVAVLLAGTGIYGAVAQGVADRRHELGVRRALGAGRGQVAARVVVQGVVTAVLGGAAGLVAAWFASRALAGLVYGIGVHDVRAFSSGLAVLVLVAALASWVPARRASRVSPLETLRAD